jgi:zinc D-Ala-D-Ala dipeptidase
MNGVTDGFDKPIPLKEDDAPTALNYHSQLVNLELPHSKEPLVKAKDFGLSSESYYARTDGTNTPYNTSIPGALQEVWMRQSVAELLVEVNNLLLPLALEVHLLDAYRPIETQKSLWAHFIEVGKKELETDDPVHLREFAGQFVSDPSDFNPLDSLTWPTHNTGGAVDVTLRRTAAGEFLDMGSGYDEPTPLTFTDAFERALLSQQLDSRFSDALNNRRILYNVMHKVGFVNYPYEWWHFDYGTQMWLQNGGGNAESTTAWYGPAIIT